MFLGSVLFFFARKNQGFKPKLPAGHAPNQCPSAMEAEASPPEKPSGWAFDPVVLFFFCELGIVHRWDMFQIQAEFLANEATSSSCGYSERFSCDSTTSQRGVPFF